MPQIELVTQVAAPPDRCFDLSRSIDLHQDSLGASDERAVAGVTTGLLGLGEWVTWEATHLGVRQRLTSRITVFDRPLHFRDSMVSGAFRRFDHDHWFHPIPTGGTLVRDVFDFDAPLGVVGRVASALFLTRYMRRLLTERNAMVKRVAESDEWRRYLQFHPAAGIPHHPFQADTQETPMTSRAVPMIHVPDVAATAAWYSAIGFTVERVNEDDGVTNWALLTFGASEIMFSAGGQPSAAERREMDLYIHVADIERAFAHVAPTAELVEALHDTEYGMREFIVRDLNRFWITFGQPMASPAPVVND